MPIERRRVPAPDPSEFANSRSEIMYWATENLLDEAPEIGKLQTRYLYDSWHRLKSGALQNGESDHEASEIAWGSVTFFVSERLTDMVLAFGENPNEIATSAALGELRAIQEWNELHERHWDEESKSYKGEPFFNPLQDVPNRSDLYKYSPSAFIDTRNPNSPLFGHIQILDRAVSMQPIPDELKNEVLELAMDKDSFLEHMINDWNDTLLMQLHGKLDEEDRVDVLGTCFRAMVIATVDRSWGDEETFIRRLALLDVYFHHFREASNPFLDSFSLESFDKKHKEWSQKRGESEKRSREYYVPATVLSEIKFKTLPELKHPDKPAYYATRLESYRGLDFGFIITWDSETQEWLGNAIISHEGNQPPRAITNPVRLLDVKSPAEALAGLLDFYEKHIEELRIPKKAEQFSQSQKNEVLQVMKESKIKKLGPFWSVEEITTHFRSLLKEVDDFEKFPSEFLIAVSDLETDDIYLGHGVIERNSIAVHESIKKLADYKELIEMVDQLVVSPSKQKKVIVCSDTLYRVIKNDDKSKERRSYGMKTEIKRPGGIITIYRGQVHH